MSAETAHPASGQNAMSRLERIIGCRPLGPALDQLSWNSERMRFQTMNSSPLVAR